MSYTGDKNVDYQSQIEKFAELHHSKIYSLPDDVLILAQTPNSYWLFWYDNDCSDCVVGRFDKNKCTLEEFIKAFDTLTTTHRYFSGETHSIKLKGWISG